MAEKAEKKVIKENAVVREKRNLFERSYKDGVRKLEIKEPISLNFLIRISKDFHIPFSDIEVSPGTVLTHDVKKR